MTERGTVGPDRPGELSVSSARDATHASELGGEVIAASPQRRTVRIVAVVASLVVVFGIGWGMGYDQGVRAEADRGPTSPPSLVNPTGANTGSRSAAPTLTPTGEQCAVQVGEQLWLGIELVNSGSGRAVIRRVRDNLPLRGLRATQLLVGGCGQLEALDAETENLGADREAQVDAGASVWVSGIFDVLVDCPAPYPVQLLVSYSDQDGANLVVVAGVFNDLGAVTYSGCA